MPSNLKAGQIFNLEGQVDFKAAATDDKAERRRFSMKAYSGKPVMMYGTPVVFDMAGMSMAGKRLPIYLDHDTDKVVGHADEIDNDGTKLGLAGFMSNVTEHSARVAGLADEGFPWAASIGAAIDEVIYLSSNKETKDVNGYTIKGPAYVVTEWRLKETSFTAIPRDDKTDSKVLAETIEAAASATTGHGETTMATPNDKGATTADTAKLNEDQLAAARNEAIENERGRHKRLSEAFATDAKFASEQFAKGHDVAEAKAEWADVLAARLAEANGRITELESKVSTAAATVPAGDTPPVAPTMATPPAAEPSAAVPFSGGIARASDEAGMPVETLAQKRWAEKHESTVGFETLSAYTMWLNEEVRVAEVRSRPNLSYGTS